MQWLTDLACSYTGNGGVATLLSGGAIFVTNPSCSPVFSTNIFYNNSAAVSVHPVEYLDPDPHLDLYEPTGYGTICPRRAPSSLALHGHPLTGLPSHGYPSCCWSHIVIMAIHPPTIHGHPLTVPGFVHAMILITFPHLP